MDGKPLSREEFLERVASGQLSRERALTRLTERLHEYERKYNLRSEVFYKLIVGTPAEDHPDFLAWAICYRSYFRTLQAHLDPAGAARLEDLPQLCPALRRGAVAGRSPAPP